MRLRCLTIIVILASSLLPLRASPPPLSSLPVVLTINDSNSADVIFTATSANSFASDSSHPFFEGIVLASFYTAVPTNNLMNAVAQNQLLPFGNLPNTGSDHYNSYALDSISGSARDLNFFSAGSDDQIFTSGIQALTGADIIDYSFTSPDGASLLPAPGTKGYLYSGFSSGDAVIIGSWAVVPEPSSTNLLAAGLVLGVLTARRSNKRARIASV